MKQIWHDRVFGMCDFCNSEGIVLQAPRYDEPLACPYCPAGEKALATGVAKRSLHS